jgi:hypothetical protein
MNAIYPHSDGELNREHANAIQNSKVNGHNPSHQFKNGIVFCKTCNALLTYHSFAKGKDFIAGLSFAECK